MAWSERYVTAAATGGGDGLAEGTAWTLDEAAAGVAAGHRINIKGGTDYARTAVLTFATAGPYAIQGYTTTPGDGGRFVMDGGTSGAAYVLLSVTGAAVTLADFELKNNGATGASQLLNWSSQRGLMRNGVVHDSRGNGVYVAAGPSTLVEVEAYGCNQNNSAFGCGFRMDAAATLIRCVSHDNAGSNSSGFAIGTNNLNYTLIGCIADTNGQFGMNNGNVTGIVFVGGVYRNNGADGIRNRAGGSTSYYENVVIELNGGYGIENAVVSAVSPTRNVAYRSNTSGNVQSATWVDAAGTVLLTADPFTDAANGDFRPNTTAGGGAELRGAGRGTFTQTQTGYTGTVGLPDIGAAQHADPVTDYPAAGDVRSGVAYNSGAATGTLALPAEADVKVGVQYGATGTEFTGTYVAACDYPAEAVVVEGEIYASGLMTGAFVVPAEADVRFGEEYGYNGALVGELHAGINLPSTVGEFQHLHNRIIAQLLVDRGLATDPAWWSSGSRTAADNDGTHDWPAFAGNEPDEPSNCITVYKSTDQLDSVVLFSGEHVEHYGIQIRIRGRTADLAGMKAIALKKDLTERASDQVVTMSNPTAQYLVIGFPTVRLTDAYRAAPGSNLWAVSLNCFVSILAYPI